MIKFLATTIGTLLAAVGFLYYLVNNANFTPFDASGNYLIMNIVVLGFLLFLVVLCLCFLIIFGIRQAFTKEAEMDVNIKISIRYGILLTLGLLIVYLLHFFHILNFVWGISLLGVVILSLFVI